MNEWLVPVPDFCHHPYIDKPVLPCSLVNGPWPESPRRTQGIPVSDRQGSRKAGQWAGFHTMDTLIA
jgi:hypothetical protein